MTVSRFYSLLTLATIVSIAVGVWVGFETHWPWGILAYFVTDLILAGVLVVYYCENYE